MATNTKTVVEDVKKAATEAVASVKEAATAAKESETAKKATETAKKATATAKKTATKAKATTEKAVKKAKKEVVKTTTLQFSGKEYKVDEIMKLAEEAFKRDYKKKTIEEINIYIKPEENKVYYVVNGDCVGSADL